MYPDTDQRKRKEIKVRDEVILVRLLKPVQTEFHYFSTE